MNISVTVTTDLSLRYQAAPGHKFATNPSRSVDAVATRDQPWTKVFWVFLTKKERFLALLGGLCGPGGLAVPRNPRQT
jgi:hypothetical protein